MASGTRPKRGTRPANRYELIVAAATELFRTRGYEHVSMSDIADAVAVGASALYRHVPSKQQLLKDVIFDGVGEIVRVLEEAESADLVGTLRTLAELTVTHRHVGSLWEREARHLPDDDQLALHQRSQELSGRLADMISASRSDLSPEGADLLARIVLGILISPSFYHSDLSAQSHAELLAGFAARVLGATLPAGYGAASAVRAKPAGLLPQSRREALLAQAIRLFAERRYASVGIEDVGASIGIAGQSVYNHFASKADLLVTAFNRGNARLYMDLSDVLAGAPDSAAALTGLVRSYTRFALGHPALGDIFLAEVRNLPEPQRESMINAQRDYVNEWVYLLCSLQPALTTAQARVQIQAVLSAINYVSRIRHLRAAEHAESAMVAVCCQTLGAAPRP